MVVAAEIDSATSHLGIQVFGLKAAFVLAPSFESVSEQTQKGIVAAVKKKRHQPKPAASCCDMFSRLLDFCEARSWPLNEAIAAPLLAPDGVLLLPLPLPLPLGRLSRHRRLP